MWEPYLGSVFYYLSHKWRGFFKTLLIYRIFLGLYLWQPKLYVSLSQFFVLGVSLVFL